MEDTNNKKSEWVGKQLWFYNTLPPSFKNWLDFYDEIPSEYRTTETVEFLRIYESEQIMAIFGIVPAHREPQINVVHSVQKDYLLARVAEILLPSRLSKGDVNALRMQIFSTPTHERGTSEVLLDALYNVAIRSK